MLVTDRRLAEPAILAAAALAAASSASVMVQLREKDLPAARLLAMARFLREELAGEPGVLLSLNGRFDLALAAGAGGVHLTSSGPPVARVRAAVGEGLRIGASTHSESEVRKAERQGADYVLFGPVFETPSKRGMGEAKGLPGLAAAVRAAGKMPVLAVGGIDAARAARCLEVGARGVAVIRAVLAAADPALQARRIGAVVGAASRTAPGTPGETT